MAVPVSDACSLSSNNCKEEANDKAYIYLGPLVGWFEHLASGNQLPCGHGQGIEDLAFIP